MSKQFYQWLSKLEIRVAQLKENMKRWPKKEVSRNLSTCYSFLNHLSTESIKHGVDLDDCEDRLSAIHESLLEIQEELARKSWFMKAVGLLKVVIRMVCDLLNVPSLGRYLAPPDDDDPLLLD